MVTVLSLILTVPISAQTNNYFGGAGALNGNVWSTNISGPYISALVTTGGTIMNFNSIGTAAGATIPSTVAMNFNAPIAWTAGGTIGSAGTNLALMVSAGVEQDFGAGQNFSGAATAATTKNGGGTIAMSGGGFAGGFTLNAGTVIVRGVNAMGNGPLHLLGGIVASNANRDLSGRYTAIDVAGDIQFGDITGLANPNANLSFDNNLDLGSANHEIKIGNNGIVKFGGIISGSAGISFNSNSTATGVLDITNTANSFAGPVNIRGGKVRFAADGGFGDAANPIILDGGQLTTAASYAIHHDVQLGQNAATSMAVDAGLSLTIDGKVTDKTSAGGFTKYGAGALILSATNSYTGLTQVDVNGGTLQLDNAAGNAIPPGNDIVLNGGVLRISSDQSINNLTMAGGNLTIDDNKTLTIGGTLDYFQPASITLTGSGKLNYGPMATLKYSGTIAKIAGAEEWPANFGPANVIIDNAVSVELPSALGARVITGSLVLTKGIFKVGANVILGLNGAALINAGGFIAGNSITSSTADLVVSGITGGNVLLPTNGNIGLRNVTIGGTRTVSMNGLDHLNLSGALYIGTTAAFDNGGESQIIDDGGSVTIDGSFITRDAQGLIGPNSSIPGIRPTLNAGSTIEYGLATGGAQLVSSSAMLGQAYFSISFSGAGIKLPANAIDIDPNGSVKISGSMVTVDASANNIGPPASNSASLVMNSGRLILGTAGTQPNMNGVYAITGGVIEFAGNTNQTIRSKTYQNIEVTGTDVGNSNGNITLNDSGSFTVKNGGVFTINDNSIQGDGIQTVTIENGAIFNCGNNEGFHGYWANFTNNSSLHANIETVILQPGSTITYAKAGDQNITNTVPYHHLLLSGTGIKKAPAGELQIGGNLLKTAACSFEHNNGKVMFKNSSVVQELTDAGSTPLNFYDLTIDNRYGSGLNVHNNINIGNELAIKENAKLTLVEGDIRLLSSASSTARVRPLPNGAAMSYSGSGRFIVDRYFPARRAWRLITAPLSSTGSIFDNWQNGGINIPGIGALVTGPNPSALNGLDPSPMNNSSLKQGSMLEPVVNTRLANLSGNSGLADNVGYFMFVRGDRDPANTNLTNTNNTTLSCRGILQTGSQLFPAMDKGGEFTLIGNPYASPVDFSKLVRVNVENRFYSWDPGLNRVGAYVVADDLDNDGVYTYSVSGPGGQDRHIQSGQAFFVQTSVDGPASISFSEDAKSAINNPSVFRPLPPNENEQTLRINLYVHEDGVRKFLADGTVAEFRPGGNAAVDWQDALKFTNVNESLSLKRAGRSLAIERRPFISLVDTLFLELTHTAKRNYSFELHPGNFTTAIAIYLEDAFLHRIIPVDESAASRYAFSVTDDESSHGETRFRLVFKSKFAREPLFQFVRFVGARRGGKVWLEWTVRNGEHVRSYTVERSPDGLHFTTIGSVLLSGQQPGDVSHHWIDKDISMALTYYRIRQSTGRLTGSYSKLIRISAIPASGEITLRQNPIIGGLVQLHFPGIKTGNYMLKVFNNAGQEMATIMFRHESSKPEEHIQLGVKPPRGMYSIQIISPGGEQTTLKAFAQ